MTTCILSLQMNNNPQPMIMKRLLFAFLFSIIFSETFSQKNDGKYSKERFQAELEQYITKKACLTPNEAAKFFPLYKEMRKKQLTLHFKSKNLKRIKPTTEINCRKNIIERDEIEIEKKMIQKTYHEKFLQILPAKKVYDILNAEDRFHRQMFKRTANKNHKKK